MIHREVCWTKRTYIVKMTTTFENQKLHYRMLGDSHGSNKNVFATGFFGFCNLKTLRRYNIQN